MGSRKRQDLLSKLGAWEPWERVEGEGRGGRGVEKIYSSIKTIKKNTEQKVDSLLVWACP